MGSLRRRLRACSVIWLLCQAAFLSAFVPRDCCAEHRAHQHGAPECHEAVQKPHCPMPSSDAAAACPMHQQSDDRDRCRMRGTCDGPLAQIAHLFSSSSLPLASFTVTRPRPPVDRVAAIAENAVERAHPPDAPPPRF